MKYARLFKDHEDYVTALDGGSEPTYIQTKVGTVGGGLTSIDDIIESGAYIKDINSPVRGISAKYTGDINDIDEDAWFMFAQRYDESDDWEIFDCVPILDCSGNDYTYSYDEEISDFSETQIIVFAIKNLDDWYDNDEFETVPAETYVGEPFQDIKPLDKPNISWDNEHLHFRPEPRKTSTLKITSDVEFSFCITSHAEGPVSSINPGIHLGKSSNKLNRDLTFGDSQLSSEDVWQSFQYSYDGVNWNDVGLSSYTMGFTFVTNPIYVGGAGQETVWIKGNINYDVIDLLHTDGNSTFCYLNLIPTENINEENFNVSIEGLGDAFSFSDSKNFTYMCLYLQEFPVTDASGMKFIPSKNEFQRKDYNSMFSGNTYLKYAPHSIGTKNEYSFVCSKMFDSCTSLIVPPELPALKLVESCYYQMFEGCESLTTMPKLPATELADNCYGFMFANCGFVSLPPLKLEDASEWYGCYHGMFEWCHELTEVPLLCGSTLCGCEYMFANCTSLSATPIISADTISFGSNNYIFNGCTGLTTVSPIYANTISDYAFDRTFATLSSLTGATIISAETIGDYSFNKAFSGCTELIKAPELYIDVLGNNCYYAMFSGCTSLTVAPLLSTTALTNYCYSYMFDGCTNLTAAPELPSTTLTNGCYAAMFRGCTSLTTAPELPAETMANSCYNNMFRNCSNLNYIKALFTTTPSTTYTNNWVNGVANSGTFVKNSEAQWNVTGVNGVPSGWTIQTESPS